MEPKGHITECIPIGSTPTEWLADLAWPILGLGKEAKSDIEDNSCLTELRGEKITVLGGNPSLKKFQRNYSRLPIPKLWGRIWKIAYPEIFFILKWSCGFGDLRAWLEAEFPNLYLNASRNWMTGNGCSVSILTHRILQPKGNTDLNAKGLDNSVAMSPDSLPIPFLLSKVDLHLTGWSTTCREASIFEVPTIFFDQRANSFYRNEISEGHFVLSLSMQSLSSSIDRAFRQGFVPATQNHIETTSHFTRNALEEIFKN